MTLSEFLLERIGEDELMIHCEWNCHERVYRECEAKLRIVEHHRSIGGGVCNSCYTNGAQDEWHAADWPCPTLCHLAAVYADHPDFREEWKA